MAGANVRRPIPALVFLLALSLVSGLVWWRVLHRDNSSASGSNGSAAASCTSSTAAVVKLPQPATVTVTVLNATNTVGLAQQATDQFKARGFQVAAPGNDTARPAATTTEVRYGAPGAAGAKLVQIYLPGAQLVPTQAGDAAVVVSLGSTFTAVASTADANAAIAAAAATGGIKAC